MLQNQLLLMVFAIPYTRCVSSAKLIIVLTVESLLHIDGLLYKQANVMRSEEKR